MALKPGDKLGSYEIVSAIGKGRSDSAASRVHRKAD